MLELMINKERVELGVPHPAGLLQTIEGALELKARKRVSSISWDGLG